MTALEDFLAADTRTRLQIVKAGEGKSDLVRYLGDQGWEEYRRLADRVDEQHLSTRVPPNLLFVPGIMGTGLKSETKGGVWWIDVRTRNHIDDLGLSPDGLTDRNRDDQITPDNVDTSYEPFLTAALESPDFGHRTFGYDWRKVPSLSAELLADKIAALHQENGGRPVNLVGHSMGGLVIRAALMEHGARIWPMIRKIVFIGTPHYGSPAIAGYLKNHLWGFELMALLGLYLSRDTFRSLRGALAMLPAPAAIYPGTRENDPHPWRSRTGDEYVHPCANFDLYDASAWKLDLKSGEEHDLQEGLNGAREFHQRLFDSHLQLTGEQRDRMAAIVGVGSKTLFRIAYKKRFFGVWEHAKKDTTTAEGDPHREGDGRVTVASAALEGVGATRYVRGAHGNLPNLPSVYKAVFDFLNDKHMDLPDSPADARSAHLAAGDDRSATPTLDGSAPAGHPDDRDSWDLTVDPQRVAELQARLEREELPQFHHLKLL